MDDEKNPKHADPTFAAHLAAAHAPISGAHTHAHPTYGSQGGDRAHDHLHTHSGPDANHQHTHAEASATSGVPVMAAGSLAFVAAATAETEGRSLVAATMAVLGAPWGIEQRGDDAWELISTDGDQGTFASYQDAIAILGERAFADVAARPVLAETWRSEMAYEGVETGDGRYIEPGALQYRATPMPLMLQTVTDMGHFGAVLCGTILQAGTVGTVAQGSGEFDDSDAGRQALQIVQARGRFGVSIDGVSPAEAEFECTERDDETGDCTDGRVKFTLLTIGGLTMTPFPAFADAFVSLEQRSVAASGEAEPCVGCAEAEAAERAAERARQASASPSFPAGKADVAAVGKADPVTNLTAAGGPLAAPAGWFANPGFQLGDERLVQLTNGGWACPLTVTPEGRVYGHMAPADQRSWGLTSATAGQTCHTGYAGRCVPPPRSPSSYAQFMLFPYETADGETVRVGQLSMGCGHLHNDNASVREVRAHYDGGPGAVQMADVSVGEDEFGIWFAGALRPDVTDEQVAAFKRCGVSGDWREAVRGKGIDLVACLAGVPVPGFPIAAAIAASAHVPDGMDLDLGETHAKYRDGRLVVLVASGVVRQPMPWERIIAGLQREIDAISGRLAQAERVTTNLRPLAAARLLASLDLPETATEDEVVDRLADRVGRLLARSVPA